MKMNNELAEKVKEISGQNVHLCYQCGKCSAGCPLIENMDMLPSQAVRLVQTGDTTVLDSKTIWECASCLTCTLRCPRGLDIAKVMEALRNVKLRKGERRIKISGEDAENLPQVAIVGASRKMVG